MFVEKECRVSVQRDRVEKVRMKIAEKIVDRDGKRKESIIEAWNRKSRWIKQVKQNLEQNGIGILRGEDIGMAEIDRRISRRRDRDWRRGVKV